MEPIAGEIFETYEKKLLALPGMEQALFCLKKICDILGKLKFDSHSFY